MLGDGNDPHCRISARTQDIAITSTGMLHQREISRAELARRLGWKRSRVTGALSGKENLRLKTLRDIIAVNGNSLLYGAFRDVLLGRTQRMPCGPVMLPTVHFVDLSGSARWPAITENVTSSRRSEKSPLSWTFASCHDTAVGYSTNRCFRCQMKFLGSGRSTVSDGKNSGCPW